MSALSTLFDQLLALPPAQHAAFLDTLEPALAAGLRELLAADAEAAELSRAGQGLPDPALVVGSEALDQRFRERRAAELSDAGFEVLRLLGRGGMGEVWLVEREVAGGRQRLALKLLQPGRNEPALLARFRSEQRILLELDHPGIARLVDAGELADGRPWLAMEYIDGPDLLTHADRARLSLKDRLKLFQQVCAAVQYAHDRLIIHRDLKPANVLVDGHGAPKLLDFGIAKILGDTGAAQLAVQTGTAQSLFSLYGVAPEQMQGQRATVATDVYALGALLYELVCGMRAHRFDGLGFAAIEKQLLHETPEAPARRLRGLPPEEQRTLAAARGSTAEQLRRELGEELDRIVLHALRKAPAERYASAREFAADVQRLLDQQPVLAVGQGRGYRLRKFIKRQRWAVAGVLLALAAIAAFILRLQTERDAAITARHSAEEVSRFMVGLFKVADPESPTHDPDIKASELLVQALKRVEIEGLAQDPDVGGPLLVALAQAANGLGNLEREAELLATARRALAGHSGPVVDELDVLEAERIVFSDPAAKDFALLRALEMRPDLSVDHRVRVVLLRDQILGRNLQQESARGALERARRDVTDSRIERAYARRLQSTGRTEEARSILEGLLQEALRQPNDYLQQAALMRQLARNAQRRGQYKEAVQWLEQGISVATRRLPKDDPRVVAYRISLAAIHTTEGHHLLGAQMKAALILDLTEATLTTLPNAWTLQSNFLRGLVDVESPPTELMEVALASIHRLKPLGARFPQWGYAIVAAVELLERQGRNSEALDLIEYALTPGDGKYNLVPARRQTLQAWAELIRGRLTADRIHFWLQSEIPEDTHIRSRLLNLRQR